MTPADVVAAILFTAVVLYSVFGGADFGSGVWDLTAGDAERGAPLRRLVDRAIGPVWEANHVWLIFVLVFLWTGFPEPFVALVRAVAVPLWLAGLGIVLRGAGFAFRKFSPSLRTAQAAGTLFALSSLITPFFLGTIAGAVASGRVPLDGEVGLWEPWLHSTSIVGGILAVVTCTFLAGVLLTWEADRAGEKALAEELRHKSLIGAVTGGAVVAVGIPVLIDDAPTLVDGLTGKALPVVLLSALAGLTTIWALARSHLHTARVSAAIAVATVVIGWGVAQYPWLLVDTVEIRDGAGAEPTLVGLIIAAGIAGVLVVPPLVYLLRLANEGTLSGDH